MELVLLSLMGVAVAFKLLQERLPHAVYRALLVAGVTAPLVATGYAMWRLPREWIGWRELTLFFGLYLATGLGTTVGFHRLLTHRSFETRASVKLVLLALGSMANQGRCIDWAAHHLKHHAHSDRDGDPHSPLDGFFHAHMGWIFRGDPAERERYCKRLLGDPVVRFVDRTSPIWVVAGLAIPFLVAGWTGLLWGGLVRIAFTNQVAFAVNSICHTFGSRPFATRDESRNNWVVAVLTLGEGWHNNHHAFPSMAFHGMKRRQPDISALVIQALVRLHLAWGVRQPSWAFVERRVRKVELARE